MNNIPKMVVHRGANRLAPENTIAAANQAIAFGAEVIELDVHESADGVLYVHHDDTLDRTTNGTGLIAEKTSAELDKLDAGGWFSPDFAGEKLPRLEDFLSNIKGSAGAYIELKRCTPQKVIDLVYKLGMENEVFSFSFDPLIRQAIKEAQPNLQQMITLTIAGSINAAIEEHNASIIEISLEQMREPELITQIHAVGRKVMVYSIEQNENIFAEILAAAPDYVNLDHPQLFAEMRACAL